MVEAVAALQLPGADRQVAMLVEELQRRREEAGLKLTKVFKLRVYHALQ